jgi:cell division control protein 6
MGIFLDKTKLLPDYLPPKLPHREKEMKRLEQLFSEFFEGKMGQKVLLVGSVGVGKTALSQSFGREVGKRAVYVYINCRITRSPFLILVETMRKFHPTFPSRGYSTEEVLNALVEHLDKHDQKLLLVLDELDYLVETEGSDFLYLLTRYPEKNPEAWRIGILATCKSRSFLDKLDASTRGTFIHNLIELNRYTADQLFDILVYRAGEAIAPGKVGRETLRFIADMASATGDARFALEILYRAGCLAEQRGSPQIFPEHVREAKASFYPELKKHVLLELRPQEVLTLLAVARRLRSTKSAYVTAKETYETYQVACEEYGCEPLAYTRFWDNLERLRALGFVTTKLVRGKGATTLLSIEEAPVEVLIQELERLAESFWKTVS